MTRPTCIVQKENEPETRDQDIFHLEMVSDYINDEHVPFMSAFMVTPSLNSSLPLTAPICDKVKE